MPQTLLALLAVVTAGLLMQQATKGNMRDQATSYESETQVQARGAAVSVLERLSGYPFDGGEGTSMGASGTDAYSPAARFGVASSSAGVALDDLFDDAAYDDLDDFDGVAGAVAAQPMEVPEAGTTRTLDLEVAISVVYAERDGTNGWVPAATGSRTDYKLVTVAVDHETLAVPVAFGRVYAAPSD